MRMNIQLTEKEVNDIMNINKASYLINLLLEKYNFKTDEIEEERSLKTLYTNNMYIENCKLNTCNNCLDIELIRERIEVEYTEKTVTENEIYIVDGGSTVLENIRNIKGYSIKEVKKLRSNILKLAKEKDIKVKYTLKTNKKISEIQDQYEKDMKEYKEKYNNNIEFWNNVINLKGLSLKNIRNLQDENKDILYIKYLVDTIKSPINIIERIYDYLKDMESNLIYNCDEIDCIFL